MKPLLLCIAAAVSTLAAQSPPPNVILILADDMGWHDTGFSGNTFTDTPNLDRMAREGLVFDQACASAPNCAPTRACLLTGQYPPRHGVYTVVDERHAPGSPEHRIIASASREALPEDSITLAETLRSAGYATGMFGMWNLGRGRSGPNTPTGQGFEVFKEPKQLGFEKDAYQDHAGRYSPDVLTDAAIEWMSSVKDRPFFLYLAFHDVHAPYDPKPGLLEKYRTRNGVINAAHAATVEAMDANIGRVLAALEKAGATQRTHVIFTSDNGGNRELVAPLNGAKGSLYQGGLRIPAVIRGPGIPGGRRSRNTILSMDWFPTVMELANINPTPGNKPDGTSLVPILRGKTSSLARDLFWHFPCYSGGKPSSAIRSGDWKLIEFFDSKTVELYDLAKDPGERHDLATEEPERAAAMLAKLHAWQETVKAPRPTDPNPAYDPASVRGRGRPPGERGGSRRNRQTPDAAKP
jgi:arylsulfatase A